MTASFTIIDSLSQKGIDQAVVQVIQELPGGEPGASTTLTTSANGVATGQVLAAPSTVIVTSPLHGSKTLHIDLSEQTALRVSFLPANGTSVMVSHTYQPAVRQGETAKTLSFYDDIRSLEYTFTATLPDGRDSVITEYLSSYQIYTFYTDLPKGTRLRVGVSSARNNLEPVETEVTVGNDNTLNVMLPLVERGSIVANYVRSESDKPALLVIDKQAGQVTRRTTFDTDGKTVTISNLPQGDYVLAALSQGMQYASISNLEQLEQYTKDQDYASSEVSVSDGRIIQTQFLNVPLCTTQLETNLSSQRALFKEISISLGHYASISVLAHFANITTQEYDGYGDPNLPTDCKLEMYVPEGFTNLSARRTYRQYKDYKNISKYTGNIYMKNPVTIDDVMKSDNPSSYKADILSTTAANTTWDEAERKLTIDWPHINEGGQMTISMLPALAGNFKPEIYLTYTLHGKKMREILQTNEITVTRSGIKVPETIIKPSFMASGTAMYIEETEMDNTTEVPKANGPRKAGATAISIASTTHKIPYYEVTVMDGDQPIGKANINAEGKWEARCTLNNPYALSRHNIYAKIAYKNGFKYQTEAKMVTYDPNAIVPLTVRMSFFNHHPVHLQNTEVIFNFDDGKASPSSYGYDNREGFNTDFTFEINLSNNDTTKVSACDLIIYTQGAESESYLVPAHYNARKNRWIAYAKFNTQTLPYSVDVKPYFHSDIVGSRKEINDILDNYTKMTTVSPEQKQFEEKLSQMLAKMNSQINAGNYKDAIKTGDEYLAYINQMTSADEQVIEQTPVTEADEPEIMAAIDELLKNELCYDAIGETTQPFNELGTLIPGVNIWKATGLTNASLQAEGYDSYKLDDGSIIYVRTVEGQGLSVVSLADDLKYTFDTPSGASSNRRVAAVTLDDIKVKAEEFRQKLNKLNEYVSYIQSSVDAFIALHKGHLYQLSKEKGRLMELIEKTKNNPLLEASDIVEINKNRFARIDELVKQQQKANNWIKFFKKFKVGDAVGLIGGILSLAEDYMTFNKHIDHLTKLYQSLPVPCPDDQANCDQLGQDILSFTNYSLTHNTLKLSSDLISIAGCVASLAGMATLAAAPVGIKGFICSVGENCMNHSGRVIGPTS